MFDNGGGARCWGGSSFVGWSVPRLLPNSESTYLGRFDWSAGHACTINESAEAHCWGNNSYGQLGDGTTANSLVPRRVVGVPAVRAIEIMVDGESSTTTSSTCALDEAGGVWCWGLNNVSQLGRPANVTANPPALVPGLDNVSDLAVGRRFACAVRTDGTVWCWGDNLDGQLGNGSIGGVSSTPTAVPGVVGARRVFASLWSVCALLADTSLVCWGNNLTGQLGDGTRVTRGTPLAVPGLSGVRHVALGDFHTCVATVDGHVLCWGEGSQYQLGTGSTRDELFATSGPVLSDVVQVSAGGEQSCALTSIGRVFCWGENELNQVGDGTRIDRPAPTPVAL
jgi:alpha-tubulin suppressor-like RCC1 family protein